MNYDTGCECHEADFREVFKPVVTDWKYIDHEPGEYPFQSSCDLWARGLVPTFDGKLWRLHGHKDARVLWEGTVDELKEQVK